MNTIITAVSVIIDDKRRVVIEKTRDKCMQNLPLLQEDAPAHKARLVQVTAND